MFWTWKDRLKTSLFIANDKRFLYAKFSAFLVFRGANKQYEYNFKNYKLVDVDDVVSYIKLVDSNKNLLGRGYHYISGAFEWEKTPEGHDYWENLNDEWRSQL